MCLILKHGLNPWRLGFKHDSKAELCDRGDHTPNLRIYGMICICRPGTERPGCGYLKHLKISAFPTDPEKHVDFAGACKQSLWLQALKSTLTALCVAKGKIDKAVVFSRDDFQHLKCGKIWPHSFS